MAFVQYEERREELDAKCDPVTLKKMIVCFTSFESLFYSLEPVDYYLFFKVVLVHCNLFISVCLTLTVFDTALITCHTL